MYAIASMDLPWMNQRLILWTDRWIFSGDIPLVFGIATKANRIDRHAIKFQPD